MPGGATAIYTSSGLAYYRHSDWLGSSRLTSTQARGLYASTAYAPFREQYTSAGTSDASFTGQDQDTQNTLYDFPTRRYSPSQGRWVSPDPLGIGAVMLVDPQTWNRYAYVRNSALQLIDPMGTDFLSDFLDFDPFDDGSGDSLVYDYYDLGSGVGGGSIDDAIANCSASCTDPPPVDDTPSIDLSNSSDGLAALVPEPDTGSGSASIDEPFDQGSMAAAVFYNPIWSSAANTMNMATVAYAGVFGGVLAAPFAPAVGGALSSVPSTLAYYTGYAQAALAGSGGVLIGKYISPTENYMLDAQELGVGYFRMPNFLGNGFIGMANQGFMNRAASAGPIYLGTMPVDVTGGYAWELQYLNGIGVSSEQLIPAWRW